MLFSAIIHLTSKCNIFTYTQHHQVSYIRFIILTLRSSPTQLTLPGALIYFYFSLPFPYNNRSDNENGHVGI